MNQMVMSLYSRAQEDRQKVFAEFCRDTHALVALSLPLLSIVFVVSPWGVPLLFGPQWSVAVVVLQILTVEAMRQSLLSLAGSALVAIGEAARFRQYAIVSTPILLVSFVAGLPWGVVGVATSFLVFNSGLNVFLFVIFQRAFHFRARVLLWNWFPGLALAVVIAGSYYLFYALLRVSLEAVGAGIFAATLACAVGGLVLVRLLPITASILKTMWPSQSREAGEEAFREKRGEPAMVFTDVLRSGLNPHLTILHKEISAAFPDLKLQELNFRSFALSLLLKRWSSYAGDTLTVHFHFVVSVYESPTAVLSFLRSLRFFGGLILCRLLRVKVVWTFHDDHAHNFAHRAVEGVFLATLAVLSDRIISFSQRGSEILWERYGRREGVVYTPHPDYGAAYECKLTRQEAKHELGISPRQKMYLFLGKILPYKGVEDLLKAFQAWEGKSEAVLFIAGENRSGLSEEVIRQCAAPGSHVRVVNEHIPDEKLQVYIQAADFGVLPYRDVLHSGTAMLFATFDCPIIVPAIGWFPEIFQDFKIGVLYQPPNQDGILTALRESEHLQRGMFEDEIRNFRKSRSLEKAATLTARVYLGL
jgi:glycosyltransferase involved in cell wall biosynthesis